MIDDAASHDVSDLVAQYEEALAAAMRLKDDARKSPSAFGAYRQAAEKFAEAANLSCEILRSQELNFSDKIQFEIFCPYYLYEADRSLSSWYYEKRETGLARSHFLKAAEHGDEYITTIEANLPFTEGEFALRLSNCLKTAKFCRDNDTLALGSNDARAAWDRDDFIGALDEYRRLAPRFEAILEQTKTLKDASIYRITLGNYLSMFANASAALGMHIDKTHNVQGVLPHDLACSLIRYTMDAYRAGIVGADANPEWSQYRDHALLCQQNVASLLMDNKPRWAELYSELHDDTEFVKLMAQLDLPTLSRLQRGERTANVGQGPLAREDLIKRITLALCTLQAYVESVNRLRLFDINNVSEDFFAVFLGELFGLSLVNLNLGATTQPAIDLGDKDAKESVQVTSDGSKAKVRKTLETFRNHQLHKEYDRLRIVVIGRRVGKYEGLECMTQPLFNPDAHVLGVPELVQSLAAVDTSKLRRLVEIINHEMPAMNFTYTPTVHLENTDIQGGKGSVGPGGDARVTAQKGGDIAIVGGTIKGGDGGAGGGKGGDAIIEGGAG